LALDLLDLGILDAANSSEFSHRQRAKSIRRREAVWCAKDDSSSGDA
jgi:hypothetical protein